MKNDYIVKKTYYSFVMSAILTSLTATVGILIDNIIVGQYLGSAALGAMGIVGPVTLVFSAIGNLCCGGATRAAQALGLQLNIFKYILLRRPYASLFCPIRGNNWLCVS